MGSWRGSPPPQGGFLEVILTPREGGHVAQPRPHPVPLALGVGDRIQQGVFGPTPWKYFP